MAEAVPHMAYHADSAYANVAFATDAMGASNVDAGGFGGAVSDITEQELDLILRVGEHPARTISRVNGDLSGCRNPGKALVPTKPLSRLPDSMFLLERWKPFMIGRWQQADHINLGETRAVFNMVRGISCLPLCRNKILLSFCDNSACAGAVNKGRSSSWPLNFLIRKISAYLIFSNCTLFLPWLETGRMPADWLSRVIVQ